MFCENCGNHLKPADRFCLSCGKVVQSAESSEVSKKKWDVWLKPAIMIAAILLLCLLFLWKTDLSESINGQLRALNQKKISEAYYSFTSQDFQKATSLEKFRQFLDHHLIFFNNKGIDIEQSSIENQIGMVKGKLIGQDNDLIGIQYNLIQDGNKWKILSIEILNSKTEDESLLSLNENVVVVPTQNKEGKSHSEAQLILPIQELLKDLNNNNLAHSYTKVSKEFQAATPFNQYEIFVKNYPILTKHRSVEFREKIIQNERGLVNVILDPDKGAIPVEFRLIYEDGNWKIWSFRIILPKESKSPPALMDPELIIPIVKDQLNALQLEEYSKAYDYSSNEFKKNVSFDAFKQILNQSPILTQYKNYYFKEPQIEKEIGKVLVDLSDISETITLEYTLIIENGKWKILKFQPVLPELKPKSPELAKGFEVGELIKVIKEQISVIQAKDLKKAYREYSAKEFKSGTTLEDFEKFLGQHTVLYDHLSLILPKLTFDNNIAILSGKIISREGKEYPIEYQLVKEEGNWKILHIQIFPAAEKKQIKSSNLEFTKVLIGKKIDLKGIVTNPSIILKADQNDVYINLYIYNGIAGTKIQILFQDIDTGASIPPVSTTLQQDGDSIITFVFSPPARGWPKGTYQLLVDSSVGVSRVFIFRME